MQPKHIGHQEFAPSEIFILLILATAAVWMLEREKRARLAWNALLGSQFVLPAALFVLAGAASTVLASDHHVALRGFREWIAEPVAYFGLIMLFASNSRVWRVLFAALIGAGVLVSSVGLVQRIAHQDLSVDPGSTILKVRSVYGSPDNVGLVLDRVIPVWLALVLVGVRDRLKQAALLALGALLLVVLFLSYSRGAWAALAITCAAMLVVLRPWGRWVALAAIVVALGVVAVKHHAVTNALSAGHSGTARNRVYIWKAGLRMLKHDPVFGIGPDNFIHYYAPTKQQDPFSTCAPGLGYLDRVHAGSEPCLSHPHDEVLDFWLSTGFAGLVAFLWIEVLFWRALWRAYPRLLNERWMIVGAGGAMMAALLHGLVDNSYFLQDLSVIFWFLCAFGAWLEPARVDWQRWGRRRTVTA